MFDLSGKTALVTGATGGIGGAIARALHAQGAAVVLSGTREAVLADLAQDLGERAFVAAANLSDPESVDGLVAFTTMPLRIWSYFGLFVSLISLLYGCLVIFETLVSGVDVPGYASLIVIILFLGGVQLISLGIIGEYLSRVYREVKGRPLYVISQAEGFGSDGVEPRSVRLVKTRSPV